MFTVVFGDLDQFQSHTRVEMIPKVVFASWVLIG